MKILVTGGTVFVSQFTAQYFSELGHEVFVLNRGTKPQVENCTLIRADRNSLGKKLHGIYFDLILDITAYNARDILSLLDSGVKFHKYIFLSSSAVYPETNSQPFCENQTVGKNSFWLDYGTDKIAAEKILLERFPDAYIVRPPYLYGIGNNIYREAFIFECADLNRKFYLPRQGKMKLQFFNVRDLCRMFEAILEKNPENHILNVGNTNAISVREWVSLCFEAAGKTPNFVQVNDEIPQRKYFPFYDYEYFLDVRNQQEILSDLTEMKQGLHESYEWYSKNKSRVNKKDFIAFIDSHFKE